MPNQLLIVPNGQIEYWGRNGGKVCIARWTNGYSEVFAETNTMSQPLSLNHWRAIARRDGKRLTLIKP